MKDNIKQNIQKHYVSMRPSEQKVADYILKYEEHPSKLLIESMAATIKVSQPTIIRFVKALGFSGFKEFKSALIQEYATTKKAEVSGLFGFQIQRDHPIEELPGRIIGTSIKMLEETLKCIKRKEYEKAIKAILEADNIVIYSVENSICTANDLMTKLSYLGLNCRLYTDQYLQNVSANHLGERDLAIGISYSGYSKDTVEMLKTARRAGARTLAITNFENAVINKYADICLCGSNDQFLYGNTIFSRISQLAIVDMLYMGVLNSDYDRLFHNLTISSKAVAKRAYNEEEIL